MRSRISHFLLCLSLMFFVGYGSSLKTYAINDFYNFVIPDDGRPMNFYSSTGLIGSDNDGINNYGYFYAENADGGLTSTLRFTFPNGWGITVNHDSFDYYVVIYADSVGRTNTFKPIVGYYSSYTSSGDSDVQFDFIQSDLTVSYNASRSEFRSGFHYVGKFKEDFTGVLRGFLFQGHFDSSYGSNLGAYCSIVQCSKGSATSDIVAAIEEQTQVIKDQYNTSSASQITSIIGSVQSEVINKMGVLSYPAEVLGMVIDVFNPSNVGNAVLVFPSMRLNISSVGQTVQLWPEYQFDLEVLHEHWPFLIDTMRTVTVAFIWLMVLRYCWKMAEKYFLSGGSE